MDESNDSSQGNAKRLKFDTESESIAATNTLSIVNNDMMSSPNTSTHKNTLQLVEYVTPLASVVLQMVENEPFDDTNKMVVTPSESTSGGKTNEPHNIDNETGNEKLEDEINDCDETIVGRVVEIGHNDTSNTSKVSMSSIHVPPTIDSDYMGSDHETQPAGPSVVRLSHLSRNYRRRYISDSSSDEDELRTSRNLGLDSALSSSRRRPEPIEEDSNDSFRYSPGTPTISSESSVSSASPSDWLVEDSDSTFDSNDRFRFEPNEEIDGIVDAILQKQKPKYAWCSVPSIMYRQNGFSVGKRLRHMADTPYNFQAGVRGSLHAVERLELMGKLSEHFGCINCLNFNQNGKLLASGSDDLKIKIWNWARKKAVTTIHTSHVSNIFQAKFIDYNGYDEDCFELVSSDQSGAVRHYSIAPCGTVRSEKLLCESPRAVHKLGLPANRPYEVLSAGEDGRIMLMDLRENTAKRLLRAKCPLYSIACHPLDSNEFCVGGQDQYVRVYDRRSVKSVLREHYPEHLKDRKDQLRTVTSAVYNYVGSEILASYSNENIYLFDCNNNKPGEYLHKYCGHRNNRTIKGVNFYGPRSEFVISGSENPGHVFFWEKQTEAIVQMIFADIGGVVNCLEPHPYVPILATSGLADEIRLWHPSKDEEPNLNDLKKFVHRNMNVQLNRHADRSTGIDIFQFILQRMRRRAAEQFENRGDPDDEASQSSIASTSDDDDDMVVDHNQLNSCNAS